MAAVSEDEAESDWLRGRLAPLVGVGGAEAQRESRDEAFTAWVRFLESIAARNPLVLVFEDLHWADGSLVEFVEHLVEWASGVPLLVVCTARPELYERHSGWGGGKRNSTTISLAPLSEPDTTRLLSALLEQAVLPPDVVGDLLERAGGNPLYAEEFIRMLTDRGILERDGSALRTVADEGGVPVPETVQALIGARLDTLSVDRKRLLQNASVVGKVFWSGAVASMAAVEEGPAREALHDLARKELVRTVRTSSVQDQAEYAFWHALVRDVAYGQIPRAERAAKHLAVAAWIESTVGERISDQAEFLAYHYEKALELSTAAGRDPGADLRTRTARALRMAGERAQRLDVAKALDFYRRAEALLPVDDPELPLFQVKTLAAASDLGEGSSTELAAAYEEAIDHLRRRGDVVGAGAMLREYGTFLKTAGSTERSERAIDEAVELLEPLGPSRELAAAYSSRAGGHMMAGHFAEWVRWTQATLDLADQLALPEYRMRALQYRGIHRVMSGDLEGRVDLEEALRLGLELGLGSETASAYVNLADWVAYLDGTAASLAVTEAGIRFAERRGLGANGMWLRSESTWRLFDSGRWDDVIEVSAEIRRWHGDRGRAQPVVIAGTQEAAVRLYRGELDAASEQLDHLLPAAREIGDVQAYRPALATAGLIAARRGRPDEARALLEELEHDLEAGTYDRAYGMLDGTRLARALGDVGCAGRIARMSADFVPAYPFGRAAMLASRAEVSEAEGRSAEALAAFESVAEAWGGLGHVFHRALALLGAARCLVALGRAPDAVPRARAAHAVLETLGATWLAAEATALVTEASGTDAG